MSKTAKFMYKCRMCGEEFGNDETAEKNAFSILITSITGIKIPHLVGMIPRMLSFHSCSDGSVGVADLIGYKLI